MENRTLLGARPSILIAGLIAVFAGLSVGGFLLWQKRQQQLQRNQHFLSVQMEGERLGRDKEEQTDAASGGAPLSPPIERVQPEATQPVGAPTGEDAGAEGAGGNTPPNE